MTAVANSRELFLRWGRDVAEHISAGAYATVRLATDKVCCIKTMTQNSHSCPLYAWQIIYLSDVIAGLLSSLIKGRFWQLPETHVLVKTLTGGLKTINKFPAKAAEALRREGPPSRLLAPQPATGATRLPAERTASHGPVPNLPLTRPRREPPPAAAALLVLTPGGPAPAPSPPPRPGNPLRRGAG